MTVDIDRLPGLKREEIRKCDECGEGHKGAPVLYVLDLAQAVVDIKAVRELAGLTLQLGGHEALAGVFSSHQHIAKLLPATRIILCQDCLLGKDINLGSLWERVNDREPAEREPEESN